MTRNTVFLLNDVSNSQSHSEWAVWLGDKGHCTAMGYTSDCFGHKLLFPVSLRAILNRHKDPERRWKQDTPNVNSQGDKQVADGNLCLRQNLEWHREPAQWHCDTKWPCWTCASLCQLHHQQFWPSALADALVGDRHSTSYPALTQLIRNCGGDQAREEFCI